MVIDIVSFIKKIFYDQKDIAGKINRCLINDKKDFSVFTNIFLTVIKEPILFVLPLARQECCPKSITGPRRINRVDLGSIHVH